MKNRLLWIAILAVGLSALYFGITRPNVSTIPSHVSEPMANLTPPALPPLEPPTLVVPPTPAITLPPIKPIARIEPISPRLEVPIQNGATIDFSTGAPVVKVSGEDKDALERALKEMADATKSTTFEAKK